MNPIGSYRDPGLDGMVEARAIGLSQAPPPSTKRSSRHSRRASTATNDVYPPSNQPFAAEVPQGAPIAYPGNDLTGHGVQRSFSQRARGRPFAAEAFADDEVDDFAADQNAQRQSRPQHVSAQEPLNARVSQPDPKYNARRQQMIQDSIRSAADEVRSPIDRPEQAPAPIEKGYDDVENHVPGLARAPTLKDAGNQSDQRDWAPDRSPLQKLEVTLNDISKEEKRARVQEAEMLHREKTRSKQPAGRRAAEPPMDQAQPSTIEDVGVVRGLSTTHKDRLQHSTIIESRKPDAMRLSSSERPGFDYQSAGQPTRSVTISRRSQKPTGTQPIAASARAVSSSHAQAYQEPVPSISQSRSVSATNPGSRNAPSDGLAPTASQRTRQKPILDSDRIPTAQERNASHRAALDRLTGSTNPAKSRTDSRRLQDEQGMRDQGISTGTVSTHHATTMTAPDLISKTRAAQSAVRTSTPQGQGIPVGLGVQDSPGMRSVDSSTPGDSVGNLMQKHKRRSSVSFKEPYERRRPVDEWKATETARLSAEDFSHEQKPAPSTNTAWWEEDSKSRRRDSRARTTAGTVNAVIDDRMAEFRPKLYLKCGPLLRYTGMKRTIGDGSKEYWRGTVMMVTQDSQSSYEKPPVLRVFSQPKSLYTRPPPPPQEEGYHDEIADPVTGSTKMSRIGRALYVKPVHNLPSLRDLSHLETDDGLFESAPPIHNPQEHSVSVTPVTSRLDQNNGERYGRFEEVRGVRLYADPDRDVTFWLFKLEIQLGTEQQHIGYRINGGTASGFWVPAEGNTMNIMFHSCNGFSMSVKPDEFSGPDPLWRDVLNSHQSRPFHVMIGGGDQIYNDKVMRDTRLFGEWTTNKNPHYKHNSPFTNEMKEELETFYLENYSKWFSSGLFAMAGSQIPMVNMWDDHDIIDGFGSYPHHFMMSPVFSGVGNIAFKYYMLFQQHSVEAMTSTDEPSWVLGYKPGPYIKSVSRSIFMDFGREIAFLALDCRTERMKNQILSVDTCDIALERCRKEIIEGQTKHLIVLLGVPIAYPRMNWLENVLTSRAMDPVKALGRYGVIKGGLLNKFDGGVEVLDDLDDHWTAHDHKEERNELIKELQDLAAERSVRITILGGDVHLAAIGQFYSNPKLKIPKDRDHRYMPNVVSSAIVNTPPPEMLADVLNKRDKIHHLDSYTDESMIPMFTHDVDLKKRNNKHLLPRRNWCSITQYAPGRTPPSSRDTSPSRSESIPDEEEQQRPQPKRRFSLSRDDVNPRMLMRRLSSRNAPPNAYREGAYPADEYDQRAASFDGTRPEPARSRSWNQKLGFTRRATSETREPSADSRNSSHDQVNGRQPPPLRPGFHRRPTNLSEKAAKKGNIPAVDAEGNEFDVNDHVNLDGGLDVVLHCEIDRRDPSGMTEPYRLLIPALWYDGSSDREKLDGTEGLQRKPTLMNRMGFGGKSRHNAAQKQGAGNWGQEMSDTESYSGSEEGREQEPKKKLGFLGSLRRKRPEHKEEQDRHMPDHYGAAAGLAPESHEYHDNMPAEPFGPQPAQSSAREPAHVSTHAPAQAFETKPNRALTAGHQNPYKASRDLDPRVDGAKLSSADARPSSRDHQSGMAPGALGAGALAGAAASRRAASGLTPRTTHDLVTAPMTTTPKETPPKMSYQAGPIGNDMPYDASGSSREPTRGSFNRPPGKTYEAASTTPRSASGKGNVLRKNSVKRQAAAGTATFFEPPSPTTNRYQPEPQSQPKYQPQYQPPSQFSTEPMSPSLPRTNSYTIGSNRPSSSRPPTSASRNTAPYDGDSAYLSAHSQQQSSTRAVSNPVTAGPPSAYPAQSQGNDFSRGSSFRNDRDRNTPKHEAVLGIGTDRDAFSGNPQQKSLRGNGILGRFGLGSRSASADQVNQNQNYRRYSQEDSRGPNASSQGFNDANDEKRFSQGYSGIEAYKEKPKRGMSLRDRAKNLFEKVEGRGRGKGDDDYDSYSDEGSYSDDLGEVDDGRHDQLRERGQHTSPNRPPSHSNHEHPAAHAGAGGNKQPYQQQQHSQQYPEEGDYSDEGSFVSDEDYSDGRPQPKRGLSQRFKGMMRSMSQSKRSAPAQEREQEQMESGYAGGGGRAESGGKYY